MRAAAADLDGSESKILEIAGRYGYENASKFACAFRKVMGKSPVEYRRMADLQMDLAVCAEHVLVVTQAGDIAVFDRALTEDEIAKIAPR